MFVALFGLLAAAQSPDPTIPPMAPEASVGWRYAPISGTGATLGSARHQVGLGAAFPFNERFGLAAGLHFAPLDGPVRGAEGDPVEIANSGDRGFRQPVDTTRLALGIRATATLAGGWIDLAEEQRLPVDVRVGLGLGALSQRTDYASPTVDGWALEGGGGTNIRIGPQGAVEARVGLSDVLRLRVWGTATATVQPQPSYDPDEPVASNAVVVVPTAGVDLGVWFRG